MPVPIQSQFLTMLHLGYSPKDALENLQDKGATRDDFNYILDSYQQGNYKKNLQNGTLDDYRYGLLKEQKIEKCDFQRYMGRVFGHEVSKTSKQSSGVDLFGADGKVIVNDGSVVMKSQGSVPYVPEQDKANGYQSLVQRSLLEIATRRATSDALGQPSSDIQIPEETKTMDVCDALAAEPEIQAAVSSGVQVESREKVPLGGEEQSTLNAGAAGITPQQEVAQNSTQENNEISQIDNRNITAKAPKTQPADTFDDLGGSIKTLISQIQNAGVSYEKMTAAFSHFQEADYSNFIDSLYEESA